MSGIAGDQAALLMANFTSRLIFLLILSFLCLVPDHLFAATPRIVAGASHTVALKRDGTVLAWGKNDAGQIGDGTVADKWSPVEVSGLSGSIEISAGYNHTVALKSDGTVWAWGNNEYGQLGDGGAVNRSNPVQVQGLNDVVAIAAGAYHTLAIRSNGSVVGWGRNSYGQLGDGSTVNRNTPFSVQGLSGRVSRIAANGNHSMFLLENGSVWTCGANGAGQLGDGSTMDHSLPQQVSGVSNISSIGAGFQHSFAVNADGAVWAWGNNDHGQLGDGSTSGRLHPVQLSIAGVSSVTGGNSYSFALKKDGTAWVWGANDKGQLGDGTTSERLLPAQVPGLSGISGIACGAAHSAAFNVNGAVWTWGNNANGQLGDTSGSYRSGYVQILDFTGITAGAGGAGHTLGLKDDQTVWAWGKNDYGQLGDGTKTNRSTPLGIAGLSGVVAISAGANHSMALKDDGTVWTWGANVFGQLGDGTTTDQSTPVQVSGLPTGPIIAIAAGDSFSLALHSNGTVWGWGGNYSGQLGDGTTTNRLAPVQVKDSTGNNHLTGISAIAAGYLHGVALTTDGNVWSWGRNEYGQLGNGTTTFSKLPKQALVSGVSAIAAGSYHTMALASGRIWTWGFNAFGQLGNGTYSNMNIPSEVLGISSVTALAAGAYHSMAIKDDGTVWGWGANYLGQLGDGTVTGRNSPLQNQTLSAVNAIAAGDNHSLAISNGTGWAAGNNDYGQMGDGTLYLPRMIGINLLDDTTPPVTTAEPGGGTYYNQVTVTLGVNEPATVRYTLDGSTPGAGSPVYAGPISLASSSTLKFFGTDTSGNVEVVKAQVYTVIPTYPLTIVMLGTGSGIVSLSTGGSCSGNCSESFVVGTAVILSPTAAADSLFMSWSGCDTISGIDCNVSMTAAKNVSATFNRAYPLELTFEGGGAGTVYFSTGESCTSNCTKLFDSSSILTLTPSPGSYSAFAGWTGCDSINGNVCSVTMTSAKNVTATFNPTHKLNLTIVQGGMVSYSTGENCSSNCSKTLPDGTTVLLTTTPPMNGFFVEWTGCDTVNNGVCTVTMNQDRNPTAYFGYLVKTSLGGYLTPQAAYDAMSDGDSLQLRAAAFDGDLILSRNINIRFVGGYNDYNAFIVGMSTLRGALVVSNGQVTVENLIIQ